MTWELLSKAFGYVLPHERGDHFVTKRLLLRALHEGKVRARGYAVTEYREGIDADTAYWEGVVEPLERAWFEVDEEQQVSTKVDIEANSMRHRNGWFGIDVKVYRLEIAREDLVKVWPERRDCEQQLDHGDNIAMPAQTAESDKPVKKTVKRIGVSGRPSYLHLVRDEVERRLASGEDKPDSSLHQFARNLHVWWQDERLTYEPVQPEGSVKGIENMVRGLWKEWRA